MTQVKIVGSDALCASGLHKLQIFEACLNQKTSVTDAGLAPISDDVWKFLQIETQKKLSSTSRCLFASSFTLQNSLDDAQWTQHELQDCGFIFATTTSQIDQWQNSLPFCHTKNLTFSEVTQATRFQSLGLTLIQLQNEFKISGPSSLVASSCSASLQALALASLWIKSGKVKRCLVGATEILSELTVNGFNSMRLLTKGVCKPFDQHRTGINLGEASAFICIEAADLSERKAQGYISGVGLSTDAFHPTAPHPEGSGSARAMQMALAQAQLSIDHIDWIHAHGTGSAANDLAESNAIQSLHTSKTCTIPVTSTKSIHGHTLGACGALESILALISLEKNLILPTFNSEKTDDAIHLNIAKTALTQPLTHILKNSLGFGGINASIVLSKNRVLI